MSNRLTYTDIPGSEEGRYTLHDINDFLRVTYYATISRTA